jgi:SAM-dependent methyltransferase
MNRAVAVALAALGLLAVLALSGPALAGEADKPGQEKPKQIRTADCVYVPTPNDVVEKMLEMVGVKKSDLLYDLGCGDGRIVVMAAKKYGCKAVGYEIVPELVEKGRKIIEKRKVEHLAKIKQEDIFKLDLSEPSVVTLYLLPNMNIKLIPQLEKLKPGSRIVAHDYPIGGIKADKSVTMTSNEDNVKHTIYLYSVPLKKEPVEE